MTQFTDLLSEAIETNRAQSAKYIGEVAEKDHCISAEQHKRTALEAKLRPIIGGILAVDCAYAAQIFEEHGIPGESMITGYEEITETCGHRTMFGLRTHTHTFSEPIVEDSGWLIGSLKLYIGMSEPYHRDGPNGTYESSGPQKMYDKHLLFLKRNGGILVSENAKRNWSTAEDTVQSESVIPRVLSLYYKNANPIDIVPHGTIDLSEEDPQKQPQVLRIRARLLNIASTPIVKN